MLGEIISGIGGLVGGIFGKKSTDKANAANIQLQKDFAQKGIQWKVADAKKAGIHPLAALGAQTASFSPSVVGDTSLSTGISQLGQDVGRAMEAKDTGPQRLANLQLEVLKTQLEGAKLDNAGKAIMNTGLASRVARSTQAGTPPAMASGGIADADLTKPRIGSWTVPVTSVSDAQTWADRYGEPGDWVSGIGIGIADAVNALGELHKRVQVDAPALKLLRDRGATAPGNYGRPISESSTFNEIFR